MDISSNPKAPTPKTKKPKPTSAQVKTEATPITLKTPKLLFPTLASLLITALLIFFTFNSPHTDSTSLNILIDVALFALIPLLPTLGLFLLHRFLEVIITHRAFRPIHLLSVATIIFAASIYCYIPELLIINAVLYLVATVVFAGSLSFQKKHSLAADPAHFRSSLLSTAVASTILSLINLFTLAAYSFSFLHFAIANTLLGIAVVVTLPLQFTLAFLCLTKLTSTKTVKLPAVNSSPTATHPSTSLLSRFDRFLLGASFAFAIISAVAYIAVSENIITEDYSHRQPCCMQPTYYEN